MDIQLKTSDLNNFKSEGTRAVDDLCKMAELLGYGGHPQQLQCNNGAFVSSLLAFFEDNPGVVRSIHEWVEETYSSEIAENDAQDDDEEEEQVQALEE